MNTKLERSYITAKRVLMKAEHAVESSKPQISIADIGSNDIIIEEK